MAGKVLANHRRKAARRGMFPADPATGDPAESVGGDRGLARAFAALGERDREAICLVAWEGLSTADAARAAGCSAATFAVRLSRARARLTRELDPPATPPSSSRRGSDMDALLERVRAANTVTEDEFAGLADFDALVLDAPPRRRRKRLLALPALGAMIAALVLIPASAPQASEILRLAVQAVEVDDGGILYARSESETRNEAGEVHRFGSRQVWVLGDIAMRWLQDDGNEEVFKAGEGTSARTRRRAS